MYYAFIDANIFVRIMSQGKPGCECVQFERLRTLAEANALTLVIPEVVRFEIASAMRDLPQTLRKKFGELKRAISRTPVWSEIEDTKQHLLTELDAQREAKQQRWHSMYEQITAFLESESVENVPYTPEIMCRAKARIMRGALPRPTSKSDQDAAIIESLAEFFRVSDDTAAVLFFCSENHRDFAVETSTRKSMDRVFGLHPFLREALPTKTHYFTRLEELLAFDQGYESLPPPPEDGEIREAAAKLDELDPDQLLDSDEAHEMFLKLESLHNHRLADQFTAKVLPKVPEHFQEQRRAAVDRIRDILVRCRACKSWDDVRSELKLHQWLEYVPEEMLPFTSLSNLVRIEDNLGRYLSIHEAADGELTH